MDSSRSGRERASEPARGPWITVQRAPRPSAGELKDALAALVDIARSGPPRPNDLEAREPAFLARVLPLLGALYDDYFRCETEIEEDLPPGKLLAVGNHNAMTGTPDMFCHMAAFWRQYGTDRLAYGLMHDVAFNFPVAGRWLNACGAIAASHENGKRALDRGATVLVFPGGDIDACKPYARRYEIEFGKRRGFIRLAIREGAPIVPIVSAGANDSLYLFTDGRRIAELLRLPKLVRSNVAPIGFALPWGLILGVPLPHLPPPVKIHTKIGRPIHLDLPPAAADDPAVVEEAFDLVRGRMQSLLDDLKRARRHGWFPLK